MFEALRCVRGTKALNFSVFLIPNLAHPLIRWVPEEPGSSPHGENKVDYTRYSSRTGGLERAKKHKGHSLVPPVA